MLIRQNIMECDKAAVADVFDGVWRNCLFSKACSTMDRTEDVKFSPDGSRLAIVSYGLNKIFIFNIGWNPARLTDYYVVTCDLFNNPHGISWIDNRVVAVASRHGPAVLLELPIDAVSRQEVKLTPLAVLTNHVSMSSNVFAVRIDGVITVLLCSNDKNHVSRYTLDASYSVLSESIIAQAGLNLPDGIDVSPDLAYIAVSNHDDSNVAIYEVAGLGPSSAPVRLLSCDDLKCPHGVVFSDSNTLLVADAGGQFVYMFKTNSGWGGGELEVTSLAAMSNENFKIGNISKVEGGPKGVDVFNGVLAITSANAPLTLVQL